MFWLMFHTSLSCCFRAVLSNTCYFVSAWLLLHMYVLVDVLDFVIVLFQNGAVECILFVSASMLLYVYVLVDDLVFVIVLFQSGVFEHVLFCVRVVVSIRSCFG